MGKRAATPPRVNAILRRMSLRFIKKVNNMYKILAAVALLFTTSNLQAQSLSNVCASIDQMDNGEMLIKSEISKHISKGDRRASGYTVVCASKCLARGRAAVPFFYSNGEVAGYVARYLPNFSGNGKRRFYGGVGAAPQHFASQIAAYADTLETGGMLYMQTSKSESGERTTCMEFNPRGRNGGL